MMAKMLVLIALQLILIVIGVAGRIWHIGRPMDPDVIGKISDVREQLVDGDVIYVHGPDPIYDCMMSPLHVSLRLIGVDNATLRSDCETSAYNPRLVTNDNIVLNIAGNLVRMDMNETKTKISLSNINFTEGVILAINVEMEINKCTFVNATLRMVGQNESFAYTKHTNGYFVDTLVSPIGTCLFADVTFTNTLWYQSKVANPDTIIKVTQLEFDILIKCSAVNVTVTHSSMGNRRLQVFAKSTLNLYIENVVFKGRGDYESKVGGISALLPLAEELTLVQIRSSKFVDLKPTNIFFGRLLSKNIHSAPVEINARTDTFPWKVNSSRISIVNCSFINNQRAIILGQIQTPVIITQCTFKDNKVVIDGGAIYSSASALTVSYCHFVGNQGGSFYHYKDLVGDLNFYFENYKASIYKYEVKGQWLFHYAYNQGNTTDVITYSYAGGGGAMYIENGQATVFNCWFINNSAVDTGGAICVSNKASASIKNAYFKNPNDINNTLEGFHIFSVGKMLVVDNVTFINDIVPENNIDSSGLFVFGQREGCRIRSLTMSCPSGYNLFIFNTSSKPRSTGNFENGSDLFDTIYYACDTCSDKYNLIGGSVNITSSFNTSSHTSNIQVDLDEGLCLPCPYGGNCSDQIVAKPNYWGAVYNNSVRFFPCPKGYCCSGFDCESFEECSYNRTGRLCGACLPGYTQALFSTHCVSAAQCDQSWIVVLAIVFGALYTAFLMFQKDITNFLVSNPLSMEDIAEVCCVGGKATSIVKGRESMSPSESAATVSTNIEGEYPKKMAINELVRSSLSLTSESSINDVGTTSSEPDANPEPSNNGGGFLVLVFYYFQDAALIKVATIYVAPNPIIDDLELIVSQLFRFRFNFFSLLASDLCIFPVMDMLIREFLMAIFAPLLIFISAVTYITFKMIYWKTKRNCFNNIALRAVSALILGLLFSYQKLATTSFSFLHCVPVLESSVLYIDGSVTCYELWQWLTLIYVIICIIPFFMHLAVAPSLLERGWIKFPEFILASLFPMPFLISWLIRFRCNVKKLKRKKSKEAETVCGILQGPYRMFQLPGILKSFCWSGNIMGRRLLLMISRTFVTNVLISLTIVFTVCILSILQHVHVCPYRDRRFNVAGTITAGSLLVVACINLLKAAFEVSEYIPQGPILDYMQKLDTVESLVLVWLPLAGLLILLIAMVFRLLFRLVIFLVRRFRRCR